MKHSANEEEQRSRLPLLRRRIQALSSKAGQPDQRDPLLSAALEELEIMLDNIQALEHDQTQQQAQWQNERAELAAANNRYHELFVHAPIGYFVTSASGTIRLVNRAGAHMLDTSEKYLVGCSLSQFVPDGQRRPFHAAVEAVSRAQQAQEWQLQLQSWKGVRFSADALTMPNRDARGRPASLFWLLRTTPVLQ